jgi:hypothetical protein
MSMEASMQIVMEVIPEPQPGTAAVIVPETKGRYALFQGVGDVDYTCGTCQNILGKGLHRGTIQHLVIKCPNCDAYNRERGN